MSTGKIEIICGDEGSGKTAMALGKAVQAAAQHRQVVIIQFLKGNRRQDNLELYKRLEPDMKIFRFEKADCYYEDLTEDAKREECFNILNGLNYAKKVLSTGGCDLLILDEALGLIDQKIVTEKDLQLILECRDETDVILTGKILPEGIGQMADKVERAEVSG